MARIDKTKFGPWALVTGASSGIGREFARQLAAGGLDVVLVARRLAALDELGQQLTAEFGVRHRVLGGDLTDEGFLATLQEATDHLDIGLVVSNAGAGKPGPFLAKDIEPLLDSVRLNVVPHLVLTHHFGRRLAARGRGGVILVSAMGADVGIPYLANDSATKAYVLTLGRALHVEFEKVGLNTTVLLPGAIDTPVITEWGFDVDAMPMKPMPVDRCVTETLAALHANQATLIPGRLNRAMAAVAPQSATRKIMGRMMGRLPAVRGSLGNSPARRAS